MHVASEKEKRVTNGRVKIASNDARKGEKKTRERAFEFRGDGRGGERMSG